MGFEVLGFVDVWFKVYRAQGSRFKLELRIEDLGIRVWDLGPCSCKVGKTSSANPDAPNYLNESLNPQSPETPNTVLIYSAYLQGSMPVFVAPQTSVHTVDPHTPILQPWLSSFLGGSSSI